MSSSHTKNIRTKRNLKTKNSIQQQNPLTKNCPLEEYTNKHLLTQKTTHQPLQCVASSKSFKNCKLSSKDHSFLELFGGLKNLTTVRKNKPTILSSQKCRL